MVTAKAPPLPPGLPLHLSSKSNGRGRGGVNTRQLFLCVHNFDCVWHLVQQSACVSQFMPWMCVEGLQQAKNARCARCDKYLSAGVDRFSSPDRFMMSSLTLEFVYFVDGCPQDGNVNMKIGIGSVVVRKAEF